MEISLGCQRRRCKVSWSCKNDSTIIYGTQPLIENSYERKLALEALRTERERGTQASRNRQKIAFMCREGYYAKGWNGYESRAPRQFVKLSS